jgi:hypothetical protein
VTPPVLDYSRLPKPQRRAGPVVFGSVLVLVWTTVILVFTAAAVAVGCLARLFFDS